MEGLARIHNQCVRGGVILVVECEAPGRLLSLALKAHGCIELHPNGQVPLNGSLVVLKPHLLVVVDKVLRCILVKQLFHVHQDVE